MKIILLLMMALVSCSFAEDWEQIFDGQTLKGWTNQGDANWSVVDGAITADKGGVCLLTTDKKYENYELEIEFKAAIGTNSGVFLNTTAKAKDAAKDCYEINIAEVANAFPTGSIVKHVKVDGQGEKNEWRKYQLKVLNGTVTVILDGKKIVEEEISPVRPAGFIGLQKNKGAIAFRNIRIREIK